ncbi:hypothetical protein [Maridesulfovibrio ferrireducens]|uniref:hypothetical protein n=1 Tax=Maridesulfovibrio ferrireducens TaxID=246191 RepID=UPI001A28ED58|nr:hypothetical protein [Maridesulfovibrio ferrireducens]MBI9112367.1 hypothetical protein [Maridesulfovibrio ferrireducens]
MNIYKLKTSETNYKILSSEGFEMATKKLPPYYEKQEKHELHFAVCPACNNPVQIIGLNKKLQHTDHPYAKHYHKSIRGLAPFDKEAFESCSLVHPRTNLSKSNRKPVCTEREKQILSNLQENFDQVAYLFQLYSGIVMTKSLAEEMLKWYVAEQGHLYKGASLINAPWVFVYLSKAQSLWGRIIKDPELQEALCKKVPTGLINERKQFISKGSEKIFFWFAGHKQSKTSDNFLKETMQFIVTCDDEDIYKKTITFDYEHFQNLLNTPDEKRPRRENFTELAKKYLG